MSALWPSAAEAATLQFVFTSASLGRRVLLAGALFALGLAGWVLLPFPFNLPGLALVVAGHLPLWVRRQSTAPGGATPVHEEVWAPVEEGWLARVEELERRGERWDVTPWDSSNAIGCVTLAGVVLALGGGAIFLAARLGFDAFFRLGVAAPLLFVPLWLNGMRTTWNPSELRKKGLALAVARAQAEALAKGDFDLVPLLALREGKRGKYPVDARLMLRPSRDDASGFLGVQLQVALNNVQGSDYPYLYAVVLGKAPFEPPRAHDCPRRSGETKIVAENGKSGEVSFLVVRQHADTSGGWHTEPEQIRTLVAVALDLGRRAWQKAGGRPAQG